MKPTAFLIFIITILLVSSFASVPFVSGQTDIDAFLGSTIPDSQIDGTIGSEWDDAGNFSDVPINPSGTANVWIKHDETDLYIAYRFTADSNNPWTAIQFASSGCMVPSNDGALFGNDDHQPNGYADISFGGIGVINVDAVQNGQGAINVDSSNIVTVELKKPLNSGDSAGHDIAWSTGNNTVLVFMWDSNGGGSSGGGANHRASDIIPNNLFLNPEAIPEIPSMLAVTTLLVTVVGALFYKLRFKPKIISKKL